MDTTKLPAVENMTPAELLAVLVDGVGSDESDILAYTQDVTVKCAVCECIYLNWGEVENIKAREFREVEHIDGWVCEGCDPESDDDYHFNASFNEAAHHSTY